MKKDRLAAILGFFQKRIQINIPYIMPLYTMYCKSIKVGGEGWDRYEIYCNLVYSALLWHLQKDIQRKLRIELTQGEKEFVDKRLDHYLSTFHLLESRSKRFPENKIPVGCWLDGRIYYFPEPTVWEGFKTLFAKLDKFFGRKLKIFSSLRPQISMIGRALGILVPLLFAFSTRPAAAWGPVGHETVAYIAEDNLTPAAKTKITAILDQGDDLASIANWADQIRLTDKTSAPWHFIDLPIRKDLTVKEEQDYCPDNNCVVNQLQIWEGVLGDESKPTSKRLAALKFVVHFMGDLHQPLHCADDNDRGGNEKEVRFKNPGHRGKGAKIKLHALWDHLLETKTEEDPRALATELEKAISTEDKDSWVKGGEADWAFESYQIAKTEIYPGMDPGPQDYSDTPLPASYYSKMRPFVDRQLEKAGIRLAFVLNEVLK